MQGEGVADMWYAQNWHRTFIQMLMPKGNKQGTYWGKSENFKRNLYFNYYNLTMYQVRTLQGSQWTITQNFIIWTHWPPRLWINSQSLEDTLCKTKHFGKIHFFAVQIFAVLFWLLKFVLIRQQSQTVLHDAHFSQYCPAWTWNELMEKLVEGEK